MAKMSVADLAIAQQRGEDHVARGSTRSVEDTNAREN